MIVRGITIYNGVETIDYEEEEEIVLQENTSNLYQYDG